MSDIPERTETLPARSRRGRPKAPKATLFSADNRAAILAEPDPEKLTIAQFRQLTELTPEEREKKNPELVRAYGEVVAQIAAGLSSALAPKLALHLADKISQHDPLQAVDVQLAPLGASLEQSRLAFDALRSSEIFSTWLRDLDETGADADRRERLFEAFVVERQLFATWLRRRGEDDVEGALHDERFETWLADRQRSVAMRDQPSLLALPDSKPDTLSALPQSAPQQTAEQIRRLEQGISRAPRREGWTKVDDAIIHFIEGKDFQLRFDWKDLPQWWGDRASAELAFQDLEKTGLLGLKTLQAALQYALMSIDNPGVKNAISLDDLIEAFALDPRSSIERARMREEIWRTLNVLSVTRIIGRSAKKLYDRTTKRYQIFALPDKLFTVTRWEPVGAQLSFDPAEVPQYVHIDAGEFIRAVRDDRRILTFFGNVMPMLKVSLEKASTQWAVAISFALNQRWRELAAKTSVKRQGEHGEAKMRFKVTRGELLEMFPPNPSVRDILSSTNPKRAIDYWDDAVSVLREQRVVGFVGAWSGKLRDWQNDRPRKGWAPLWLAEALDIRPTVESGLLDAVAIAQAAAEHGRTKRGGRRKRAQPPERSA